MELGGSGSVINRENPLYFFSFFNFMSKWFDAGLDVKYTDNKAQVMETKCVVS